MESTGIGQKKIKLSPFVKKVKGQKNYALYEFSQQRLFVVAPEGELEPLKKQLVDAGLALETNGVIPVSFGVNVDYYSKKVVIRELQVRITGECDQSCPDCGRLCSCFKGGGKISRKLLDTLYRQVKYVPVESILLTGGNPSLALDIAEEIKHHIKPVKGINVMFRHPAKMMNKIGFEQLNIKVFEPHNPGASLSEEDVKAEPFLFFYSRKFNPCWGNKIAIDLDGKIKPCLWTDETIGNIHENNIKQLVIDGAFDKYWELNKDKISGCRSCEFRYGCWDCRALALKKDGSFQQKPSVCGYNPATGCWQ